MSFRIVNALGHQFGDPKNKILRPVKTTVRRRHSLPKLRLSAEAKKRSFYKLRENGEVEAYTPVQQNKNPLLSETFQVRMYRSPTGVFIPRGARDDI